VFSAYFTDYVSGKKAEPFRAVPAGVAYGDRVAKTAYGGFGVVSKHDI